MQRPWVPVAFLFVLLVAFRTLGAAFSSTFPNFQPLPAVFLCSAIFLRHHRAWLVPLSAFVISMPIANLLQGFPALSANPGTFLTIGALLLTALLALPFRQRQPTLLPLMGLALGSALLFHLVTIVPVWAVDPSFEKSANGLWQALWTGRSSDIFPTWVFLRNLTTANLTFCLVFALALQNTFIRTSSPTGSLAQTR